MKAYLPDKFLQVALHKGISNFARLDKFITLLEKHGLSVDLSTPIESISEPGLLILTTRQKKYKFINDDPELEKISNFISAGNPLLHLSNHGNKPGTSLPDFTIQDSKIGELFGYGFHGYTEGINPELKIFPTNVFMELISNIDLELNFSVCNSSMINHSEEFSIIADFSKSTLTHGSERSAFGIAKPKNKIGAIVALADSGLLGEPLPKNPGPGLEAGNNNELISIIIQWLIHQAS
jgi:hypothetical protein